MYNSLLALFLCAVSLSADRQPNVIVIFTDDQGSVDLNCYGAKDLTTPHMDSLAKRGAPRLARESMCGVVRSFAP